MKKYLLTICLLLFLLVPSLFSQTQKMSNEDVLKLTGIGATPETIIQVINDSQPAFDLNNATLLTLINAGVDYAVINAMILRAQEKQDGAVIKKNSDQSEKNYTNRVKLGVGYDIGVVGLGVSLNIAKKREIPTLIDFYFGLRNLKGIRVGSQKEVTWFNSTNWIFSEEGFNGDSVLTRRQNNLSLFVASIGVTQYLGRNFFISGNLGVRDWVIQVTSTNRIADNPLLFVPNYNSASMRAVVGFNLSLGADIRLGKRWCLTPMLGWSQMSFSRESGVKSVFYGGSSSQILGYRMEDRRQHDLSFQLMLVRKF